MASTLTPSWTDTGSAIISPQCLARGASVRGTLNLRNKYGGRIFCGVGHGGTTALSSGVNVLVRQMPNNGGLRSVQPYAQFISNPAAALLHLVNNGAGYPAGTTSIAYDGAGSAFAADDLICSWGVDAIPGGGTALPNLEFYRCVSAVSPLVTDAGILIAIADNYILTSKADYFVVDLPGGTLYEVIFDYVIPAAGESVAVGAWSQVHDSVSAS